MNFTFQLRHGPASRIGIATGFNAEPIFTDDFAGSSLNPSNFGGQLWFGRDNTPAPITQIQVLTDVVIITATNTYSAGDTVMLEGITTAGFLNAAVLTVSATGLSGSSFQAAFVHADYGPAADTGFATRQSTNIQRLIPFNVWTTATTTTMVALTNARIGDFAIVTTPATTYILTASDPTILGNWTQMASGGGGGSGPAIEISGTLTSDQTTLNFIPGTDINITNPSGGQVKIDFSGQLAQTFNAVSHEFLTSYNASTGLFTAAQPAFTDISGTATASQVPHFTGAGGGSGIVVDPGGSPAGKFLGDDGAFHTISSTGVSVIEISGGGTGVTSTLNFVPGTDISITNPGGGANIQIAFSGQLAQSITNATHKWLNSYDASTGLFTQTQPDYSDLTGTPQLPITFGAVSHEFLTSYTSSTGLFTAAQPAFTDISGTAIKTQLPGTTVYTDQANTFGAFLQQFLAGADFELLDPTDPTKEVQFDLSNLTTNVTRTVNIPDANSTTIQPTTAPSHQFVTAVSAQGVITFAQPAFTDVSGQLAGSQMPARQTTSFTTASLANLASGTGSFALAKAFKIISIGVDNKARVQLYNTSASRTADAARAELLPPTTTGVIVDVTVDNASTWALTPEPIGSNGDVSVTNTIYYQVTNESGATNTITVTIVFNELEA